MKLLQRITTLVLIAVVLSTNFSGVAKADEYTFCGKYFTPGQADYASCVARYQSLESNCDTTSPTTYANCISSIETQLDREYNQTFVGDPNNGSLNTTTCPDGSVVIEGQECVDLAGSENLETCGTDRFGNPIRVSIDVGCEPTGNPILGYLTAIINILAGGVGLVVTAMLVYGGILYISARGNPGQIETAKKKIVNAVIALVMFIFMYALLQWLIPGGVF